MDAHASFAAPERLLAESEWLARLARSLVATADEADDLAQDTLAAALAHPPDPERPLRPWLARVAHNLAVRRGVGRARREDREERVARQDALASTADVVARVAMQRTVVEAVLALDEPYRATLLLRYWDDLAPREIAERTRVPVETVRTRLKRAVAQLRERLDRRHGTRDEWLSVLLPFALTRAPAVTATATSAGLGSIGALLVSTPMKFALAATALVLAALVVQRAVERDIASQVANATTTQQLEPLASVDAAKSPSTGAVATNEERSEVDSASKDSPPVPNLERDIVCTVLDAATQAPIEGALVELRGSMRVNGNSSPIQTLASAFSEAHGVAHLIDPRTQGERETDRAAVSVNAPSFAAAALELPRSTFSGEPPGPKQVLALLGRGTAVRGRVVATDNVTPIEGASLRVTRDLSATDGGWIDTMRELAVSDERGEFVLDRRLAPPRTGPLQLLAIADSGIGCATLGVVDGVDELRDVTVRLLPNAEVVVTVTDARSRPIADAQVDAFPAFEPFGEACGQFRSSLGDASEFAPRFRAFTDANGVVRLPRLPVEDDPVRASMGTRYVINAVTSQLSLARRTVYLDPRTPTEVTIALGASPRFTLRGTVRADHGVPLGGAHVRASDRDDTFSDRYGQYEIELGLPDSRHLRVTCEAQGHSQRGFALDIAPDEAQRTLDIEFPVGARIEGRIVDEMGRPLTGFVPSMVGERVVAKDGDLAIGNGATFAFEHVDQDPAELRIDPPDDDTRWTGPFELLVRASDSPLTLQFRREQSARVSLAVELVDATTQQPIAATEATLRTTDGLRRYGNSCPVQRTLGHLRAEHLSRGAWNLRVATASGARAERTIVVDQDDGELAVRVEVGAPGRIVGRVVFDDLSAEQRPQYAAVFTYPTHEGQWIPNAGQELERGTRGYAPVRASEGYVFRLDDVRALDRVVLTLDASPYYGRAEVSVPAGGEAQVELHAKLGGELVLVREGELMTSTVALTLRCEGESQPRETVLAIFDDDLSVGNLDIAHFNLPAGRVSWTIRYWSPASRGQPSVIEGEAQIAPGATVRAPVRF